jgi:hypothetical protein
LEFIVINNPPGKPTAVRENEEYRYKRFLGSHVRYTSLSFEEFADDPVAVIRAGAAPA